MAELDCGREAVLVELAALHDEVGREAERLQALHAARLACRRGCSACCADGLTVFEVEAERIRRHYPGLLAGGVPGPAGGCPFLDGEGACRIYPHRPYVCRTQGLPLRWIEARPEGEVVELRDICPLNQAGPPVESLEAGACWTLGPAEGRLAALQARLDAGALRRIPLRSLFLTGPGREAE